MRPAPSREEALSRMGWAKYRRYMGGQHEYTRDQVEVLLSAFWNDGTVDSRWHDTQLAEDSLSMEEYLDHLGSVNKAGKNKVQAQSRKSYVDPSETGNWPAHKIDLERGLARFSGPLVAILELHYGDGWTQTRIGKETGITQQKVSEAIDWTVSRLVQLMNGEK